MIKNLRELQVGFKNRFCSCRNEKETLVMDVLSILIYGGSTLHNCSENEPERQSRMMEERLSDDESGLSAELFSENILK